ncbi:hypothetical protein JYU34_004332 [Plutella xylostella]|uniref:FLYWCH-type domain-containing protein n=1 Tax=Plutella xylostella TaxID=51655 RepID=A0ABQ7QXU5_PLUXY|nr:hypothetical protein JYU34_004332 [Plutella xylostella]
MYRGYTFNKHVQLASGFRYNCSSRVSKKCRAYVTLSNDGKTVVKAKGHTHQPVQYHVTESAHFVTLPSGKSLLMYRGYTFSRNTASCNGFRYNCSNWLSKTCRAYVIMTKDGKNIIKSRDDHTHEPTKYHITNSGFYMRMR